MMAPITPQRIADRYELVERIGSGGAGSVWRARDGELDRDVAVKLVPLGGDLTEDEREHVRTRVSREARAAARLRHENVVTVFDTIAEADHVAIVMAYVDAPTLRQLVGDVGPLDDDGVIEIARQLVEVLAAAHEAGIVHRDIKPSNVLITRDDHVLLTDFGIASVGDETRLTRTGEAIGSPSYLAPEQARGEDPTPAADLWGLGATLYFAIAAASPFDRGGPVPSLHAVLHDEPPPPPHDSLLWPLVRRLLDKDPGRRPSVDEVRSYLADPEEAARATAAEDRDRTAVLPPDQLEAAAHEPTRPLAGAVVGTEADDRTRDLRGEGSLVERLSDRRTAVAVGLITLAALVAIVGGLTQDGGPATTDEPEPTQVEQTTDAPDPGTTEEQEPDGGSGPGRSDGRGPDGQGPPGQR